MAGRFIAIGDIHGCSVALGSLLDLIQPASSDTIITLGDYVNRGPDSRGVLTRLIALRERCQLVPLLGNHDDLVLRNRSTRTALPGMPCVDPENGLQLFDEQHFAFLESCVLYYEIDTHFFVHANYDPQLPLSDQDHYTLLWLHLHTRLPRPHRSHKIAVVGHTSQRNGEILDHPHIKCIDTYCHGGGWLTAMDVHSQQIWQVDREGRQRARG
jgi:serine/threonine protein phosphatase 1